MGGKIRRCLLFPPPPRKARRLFAQKNIISSLNQAAEAREEEKNVLAILQMGEQPSLKRSMIYGDLARFSNLQKMPFRKGKHASACERNTIHSGEEVLRRTFPQTQNRVKF